MTNDFVCLFMHALLCSMLQMFSVSFSLSTPTLPFLLQRAGIFCSSVDAIRSFLRRPHTTMQCCQERGHSEGQTQKYQSIMLVGALDLYMHVDSLLTSAHTCTCISGLRMVAQVTSNNSSPSHVSKRNELV